MHSWIVEWVVRKSRCKLSMAENCNCDCSREQPAWRGHNDESIQDCGNNGRCRVCDFDQQQELDHRIVLYWWRGSRQCRSIWPNQIQVRQVLKGLRIGSWFFCMNTIWKLILFYTSMRPNQYNSPNDLY